MQCNENFIHRHGQNAIANQEIPVIPFKFKVRLPLPRYARTIVSRDEKGRIIRSAAAPENVEVSV